MEQTRGKKVGMQKITRFICEVFKLSQITKNFSNMFIEEKSHISGLVLFKLMLSKGQLY